MKSGTFQLDLRAKRERANSRADGLGRKTFSDRFKRSNSSSEIFTLRPSRLKQSSSMLVKGRNRT